MESTCIINRSRRDAYSTSRSPAWTRFPTSMRRSGNSALLVLGVLLAACFPYGFAGGGLPSHIKTIAVLPFDNQTTASALQQEILTRLTSEVHDRLGLRAAS